jgi:hypothetical protein
MAGLAALAALLATGQPAPPPAPEAEPPAIVVESERPRTEQELTDLARDLADNPRPDRPLARFEQPLCLMVATGDNALGQEVAARIIANAKAAKVKVRGGGCSPNALVLIADDARQQLQSVRSSGRRLFAGLNAREIDAAIGARDPVYVFQSSQTTAANGQAMLRAMPDTPPENRVYAMGRLSRLTREDMLAALVVIDKAAVASLSPIQIADYASLRLLAPTGEVDIAEAGSAPPTIMTLFAAPASAPAAMTRFDRAYLAALYRMPPGSFSKEVLRAAVLEASRGKADDGEG